MIPSSNADMTGCRHARFNSTTTDGEPTVVLLLGERTGDCEDVDQMVHNQRAALTTNVHLIVIAPQSASCLAEGPGYTVTISDDVSQIARGFGVRQLPGLLLLDGTGHVVWTSASPAQASGARGAALTRVSGRTSGAVALGEIGTQGQVPDGQIAAPNESREQAESPSPDTCTDDAIFLDNFIAYG